MPNDQNGDLPLLHTIDDPIATKIDFAELRAGQFWDLPAELRELREFPDRSKEPGKPPAPRFGLVCCDVPCLFYRPLDRQRGPNNLQPCNLARAPLLAMRWGTPSPRSSSRVAVWMSRRSSSSSTSRWYSEASSTTAEVCPRCVRTKARFVRRTCAKSPAASARNSERGRMSSSTLIVLIVRRMIPPTILLVA